MSMPAETPEEVMMSPSSTYRSSGRTSMVGSIVFSVSNEAQWVVPDGWPTARPRPYQRPCADAGGQAAAAGLGPQPGQVAGVGHERSGAVATRIEDDVEGPGVAQGDIGRHDQAVGPPHRAGAGDADGDGLPPVVGPDAGPAGEHFVGAHGVELLDPVEQEDADGLHPDPDPAAAPHHAPTVTAPRCPRR